MYQIIFYTNKNGKSEVFEYIEKLRNNKNNKDARNRYMSVYEDILSNSNIVDILNYYGLTVQKNKCTCPFHNDTHPSMMVNDNKGIVKCFVCGSGGNAISFIQKYENEINHNPINLVQAMQKAIDIQHLNIVIPQKNQSTALTEEQRSKERGKSCRKERSSRKGTDQFCGL